MDRYVCIHGHFYQPPRENPWLEAVELQDSAWPYHDWNDRITAESYEPNGAARILDGDGKIIEIQNNYARMSFNFGPTLLSWMEVAQPRTYAAVLAADQESRERFHGHGSALAQGYNHVILPLANPRDRRTQVRWGVADFRHRFGRDPEGMWLPETAVDLATLDELAAAGIRFTILSPYQAHRVRKKGAKEWQDVTGGRVDPRRAYEVHLPSGKRLAVFFYDGPISRAIAFEKLLHDGQLLADRLVGAFTGGDNELVHIATDGETYGHHHPFGDMALAFAMRRVEESGAHLTNYGEYLERFPPHFEAEVWEATSWSCFHGVERWRSDCGCNSGARPDWTQQWRQPLRESLDWLRDALAERFQAQGATLLDDPWNAREAYIDVILDRGDANVDAFLERHGKTGADPVKALKLLEMQRQAMLMFTSCGWFFDELSGIETVQVLHYAARAIQLAEQLGGRGLEDRFLERLQHAKSNLPDPGDGRAIYERYVKPAVVDLHKVAAHYAVSSLFENYDDQARIYCYTVEREAQRTSTLGNASLVAGRARVRSGVTRDEARLTYGVVHLGDHNVNGGVREFEGEEAFEAVGTELIETFARADLPETIRLLDRSFGETTYSLRMLFRDEQRKVMDRILEHTLAEAETVHQRLYETHASLLRFLRELQIPLPKVLRAAAESALNGALRRAVATDDGGSERLLALVEEARLAGIDVDAGGVGFALSRTVERRTAAFFANPDDGDALATAETWVALGERLPFPCDFRHVQDAWWRMREEARPARAEAAEGGDEAAADWVRRFDDLGRRMGVRV